MPSTTSSIGRYTSYPSYSSYPSYRSSSAVSSYLNRTTSLERAPYIRSSIGSSYYSGLGYCGSSGSSSSSSSSSSIKRSSALPPRPTYSSSTDSYRSSRSSRVSPAKSSFSRLPSDSYLLRSDRDSRYSSTRYREYSASRDSGYGSHITSRDRSVDLTNGNGEISRKNSLRRRESDVESELEKVRVIERIRAYEGRKDPSEERLAERRRRLGFSPSPDTGYSSPNLSSKLPHSLSSEDNRRTAEENGNDERRPSVTELCRQYSSNLNLTNGSEHLQELTGCSGGSGPSTVTKTASSVAEPSVETKISRLRDSMKEDVKSSTPYVSFIRPKSPIVKETTDSSYKTNYWRNGTSTTPYRSKAKERIAMRLAYEVEDADSPPSRRRTPTGGSSESFSESNGLVGLRNIGNTCFLNSIIQCLSNTRCLMEYLVREGYSSDINTTLSTMKGDLVKAFANLLCEMWREGASDIRSPINTGSFKSQIQRFAPVFIGYAQHDAQEFLRKLLEGLHEDVNRVTVRPRPITEDIDESLDDHQKAMEAWKRYLRYDDSKIVDMFVGQLKSSLQCSVCGHRSVTFDPFWDLSLPIPSRSGQVKLTQCLDLFTKVEVLDGDESPTCSKCKERRKMTKSLNIQKFPKVLVLHLKRFSPHERWRGKLTCMVEFPLDSLDLSRYAACASISSHYRLIGVANHSGTALSGHYTAYGRHPYLRTWHEYNDSRVSSISSNRVCSPEAYVLFYELNCSY